MWLSICPSTLIYYRGFLFSIVYFGSFVENYVPITRFCFEGFFLFQRHKKKKFLCFLIPSMGSYFAFKFLVHLEYLLVYNVRCGFNFSLQMAKQLSQQHALNSTPLPTNRRCHPYHFQCSCIYEVYGWSL